VLMLDMIEVLPPLGKYKHDTWRILLVKCYIDNFMHLRSCIRNVNRHLWSCCQGGSQYLLSVYTLHKIILASIISLPDLSASLCLCVAFAGRCVTGFDLPTNYHSDLEPLIRKSLSRFSSLGSSGSHIQDIVDKFQGSPPPQEPTQMAGRKCINDFSALCSSNVRTGLETNVRDGSFELKPALINMVQQSPFRGKASEDANAHLQHFLEICSTFTIRGVTQDVVRLRLFLFSLLGKVKQWFYFNKEAVSTSEKCSNAFLAKFFPLGKTNALWNKISNFQQLVDETIAEAWEHLQYYISACPHHGMDEWFIIQTFDRGLIRTVREHIDAATRGSFFALSVEEAHRLIEKMTSNQSWDDERTLSHTRKIHQLEEVDMLTAKIDLLMKKLENSCLDHLKMVDA
jgi:hypothetical protein